MSSNQPPHKNDSNQVPSWDEFNMMAHEDDEEVNLNENGLLLDGPVDEDSEEADEIVVEPGQPDEYGPSLPPGFGVDDSQDGQPPFAENEIINNNDFSAPFGANDLDLDDPEDPLQCSTSSAINLTNNSRSVSRPIGPSIPSSMLPRISMSGRGDEHFLPSIGNYNNTSSSSVDFIPFCDQPSSSNSNNNNVIGPTLPPDLNLSSNNNGQSGFPSFNELDDIGGPALPPDEPQICSSSSHQSNSITSRNFRKQRNSFGPTLPCSSDEEEDHQEEEEQNIRLEEGNLAQIVLNENEAKDFDIEQNINNNIDQFIGPIPPVPGRSEDEEHFEYLARLAEFEENKKASNCQKKREEWMTELPQKMLKTGAYGLSSKTSFSRSSGGGPIIESSSLWTSIPNGGQQKKKINNTFDYNGPSTSSSFSSSSNIPKPPTTTKTSKQSEHDELAEKRAAELNKERNESLLDIHYKKRKLESNKNGGESSSSGNKPERRPFNRDTDLEIRGGNKNTKGGSSSSSNDPSALKERVGDLSNRFGNNSDKKFL